MYRFSTALLQPLPLLCLLVAIGLVALWWRRVETRKRLLLAAVPFILLWVACTPIAGHLAIGSLEWAYPPRDALPDDAGAIVILGGYIRPPDDTVREAELGAETLLRCVYAARLYHQGRPRLIVVSGGKVDAGVPGPTLAHAMRDLLVSQGIKENDLLVEDQSRTTYENALLTAKILSRREIRQIVLVTSAVDMRRAEGCFLALEFQVMPFACDYRATRRTWSFSDLLPNPDAASAVHRAAHEWLGIVWYWFHSRL
jgi:uncharacterized SAM-binding protein YcdF (DUF218 family)